MADVSKAYIWTTKTVNNNDAQTPNASTIPRRDRSRSAEDGICRSQIESSYSQPSRKFRFLGRVTGPDGNVRIASPGVAPGGVVQSRGDGVGSEAIGGSPPVTQNP